MEMFPLRICLHCSISSRYEASVCKPSHGPKQFPIWYSRHILNFWFSMLDAVKARLQVLILYNFLIKSSTLFMAFTFVYGPKNSPFLMLYRLVEKTFGNRSFEMQIKGKLLSSFNKILYLGWFSFIRLFSNKRASNSESTIENLMLAISFTRVWVFLLEVFDREK